MVWVIVVIIVAVGGYFLMINNSKPQNNKKANEKGQKNSIVTMEYANGNRYEGECENSSVSGNNVVAKYVNGEKFEGCWLYGLRNGYGVMKYVDGGLYEGFWTKDKKNGNGVMTYPNGNRYKGEWLRGKKNGKGVMTYANGNVYNGLWENDKKNGRGVMIYANGDKYEGQWQNEEIIVYGFKCSNNDKNNAENEKYNNKQQNHIPITNQPNINETIIQVNKEKSFAYEQTTSNNLNNENNKDIIDYLKKRNVKYLVHFTQIDNLLSILNNGIIPKLYLERNDINYKINDSNRYDEMEFGSCFTFSFPNYRMLYKIRKECDNRKYVILLINISVISSIKYNHIAFFPTNVANSKYKDRFHEFHGINAVKSMFSDNQYENNKIPRFVSQSYYTSDPQAEIVISDVIGKSWIDKIICENDFEKRAVKKILKQSGNVNSIPVVEDKSLYAPRCDYEHWKKKESRYNNGY